MRLARVGLPPPSTAAVVRLAVATPCLVLAPMLCVSRAQGLPPIATSPPSRQIVTNPTAPPATQTGLSLTFSAFESYDRNEFNGTQAGTSSTATPIYQQSGAYGGASGSLDFTTSHKRGRATFSSGAHGDANAHSSTDRVLLTAGVVLNAGVPIGRRTTIEGSGAFGYTPYYNFGLFPALSNVAGISTNLNGGAFDPNINLAVAPTRQLQLGGGGSVVHQISLRSS